MNTLERYRANISSKVCALRKERRWSQGELARLLGVSQSWLSDIEHCRGSFSAEQLLLILRTFNVTADYFVPKNEKVAGSQIQNALARLGARHLFESSELLPSERLQEAAGVIQEVLISAESPRHVTALAPVIVNQIHHLNLRGLQAEFARLGFDRRYGWLLDSLADAIRREENQVIPREWRLKYRRTSIAIDQVLSGWKIVLGQQPAADDILDRDIASEQTISEVRQDLSEVSRRWKIITRIGPDDFLQALRTARESN